MRKNGELQLKRPEQKYMQRKPGPVIPPSPVSGVGDGCGAPHGRGTRAEGGPLPSSHIRRTRQASGGMRSSRTEPNATEGKGRPDVLTRWCRRWESNPHDPKVTGF